MSRLPHLLSSFEIKGLQLPNRLVMPPMCQYMAQDGVSQDWHFAHYAARAAGGVGLIIVEMTNVAPNGRITPRCLGLWNDAQRDALRRIVDFAHACGSKIGIQIGHAGRKAQDCDDVVAPSALPYGPPDFPGQRLKPPRALATAEVQALVQAFADAVGRAVQAGFDLIELHGAHGYLIHQFYAPASNQRSDAYGQDRMLFGEQVVQAARAVMPAHMPLAVRISAQEYSEGGFGLDYGLQVARRFAAAGADLLHVSAGGNGRMAAGWHPPIVPGYQVEMARQVKQATGLPVIAVGLLDAPELAEHVLASGSADLVAVGRALLRDPHWLLNAQYRQPGQATQELQFVPAPYARGFA